MYMCTYKCSCVHVHVYIVVYLSILIYRWSLCCKSGEEMKLMSLPENQHYEYVNNYHI